MKKVILSFAFALIGLAGFAQTETHTVTLNLSDVFEIRKDTNVTESLSMTFSAAADYEDGQTIETAAAFDVASNNAWKVSVKAGAANFSPAATTATMPCTILGVRTGTAGAYTFLTTVDQELTTGAAGGFASNNFSVGYRADPGFDYPADTYTLDVVYTVSAQ